MNKPTYKAQRRTIYIGDIPLEVAMLPDGSYRLSQTQATEVVSTRRNSMFYFYRSKRLKAFLGEDFQCSSFSEELFIEGAPRPINPVTFEVACLYWQKCADEGNPQARAIVVALVKYSLYDLADAAFGVKCDGFGRDRSLAEDLSAAGVARIEVLHSELTQQKQSIQPETQTERELKLKIQLAELELAAEKLRQKHHGSALSTKEIKQIGIVSWEVLSCVQKALGFPTEAATIEQIEQLGYGLNSSHWLQVKLTDCFWVLPWKAFYSLSEAVERRDFNSN